VFFGICCITSARLISGAAYAYLGAFKLLSVRLVLQVRSDVLIAGPRMDEAVRIFIDLVLTCVEEVGAVPLYFVDGIAIMDPPSQVYEGA